jgi:hypothetical protein
VVAQLLFEGTYDTAAGHCREYHVHWGAPLDACQRLAAGPEAFLGQAKDGALESVRKVTERYAAETDLASLRGKEGTKPPASVSPFVSFHCYFEGDAGAERKSTPVSFAGGSFTVDELRVPRSPAGATLYIDRYDAVAHLLVKDFHYGGAQSAQGALQGSPAGLEPAFAASDSLLTRLYELDTIDIYLDPGWVANRPDLLEVYPYERHLKNYVQVFRRQYRGEWGRL